VQTTEADAVIKRNAEGFHVASYKSAHPPPNFACCILMKDSVSVQKFIISVNVQADGRGRIIFEGDAPGHVAALAHTLEGPRSGDSALEELARVAGGGGKDGGPGDTEYLSFSGEDGEPPRYLRILGVSDRAQHGPLYTPRDWTSVQVHIASADDTREFLGKEFSGDSGAPSTGLRAWNKASDGEPYLVELSFGGPARPGSETVANVLAGLDPQQWEAGQKLVREGVEEVRRGRAAASQSLLDGLARMKAFVAAQTSAGAVRRLNIIVTSDRQRSLITHRLSPSEPTRGG
jgi:hypothetical protein